MLSRCPKCCLSATDQSSCLDVGFGLALTWLPADQPLIVLGDGALARKHGKCVALASLRLNDGKRDWYNGPEPDLDESGTANDA